MLACVILVGLGQLANLSAEVPLANISQILPARGIQIFIIQMVQIHDKSAQVWKLARVENSYPTVTLGPSALAAFRIQDDREMTNPGKLPGSKSVAPEARNAQVLVDTYWRFCEVKLVDFKSDQGQGLRRTGMCSSPSKTGPPLRDIDDSHKTLNASWGLVMTLGGQLHPDQPSYLDW